MGPLHWSSLLNSERGLGKMILTGPGFGDFELFCSVSGMVELFMQRWGLAASFTFFRESSISRMPFCGFEAEDTSFDGCGCRSKNKKGCRTTARVFLAERLHPIVATKTSSWHSHLFWGWTVEASRNLWQRRSSPFIYSHENPRWLWSIGLRFFHRLVQSTTLW